MSLTNASALKPDHAIRAAILSTSGRLPCAMRVRVEALTRASSATPFQVCRRLLRSASRAEKKPLHQSVACATLCFAELDRYLRIALLQLSVACAILPLSNQTSDSQMLHHGGLQRKFADRGVSARRTYDGDLSSPAGHRDGLRQGRP